MDNFENVDDYDALLLILQAAAELEEREANADAEIITIDDNDDSEDMGENGRAISEAAIQENAANSKGNVTVDGDNSADTGDEIVYVKTVPELMQPWPQDVAERLKALDIEDAKKAAASAEKLAKNRKGKKAGRGPKIKDAGITKRKRGRPKGKQQALKKPGPGRVKGRNGNASKTPEKPAEEAPKPEKQSAEYLVVRLLNAISAGKGAKTVEYLAIIKDTAGNKSQAVVHVDKIPPKLLAKPPRTKILFKIEELLDCQLDDDKLYFRVKWAGWPLEDATWQLLADLHIENDQANAEMALQLAKKKHGVGCQWMSRKFVNAFNALQEKLPPMRNLDLAALNSIAFGACLKRLPPMRDLGLDRILPEPL